MNLNIVISEIDDALKESFIPQGMRAALEDVRQELEDSKQDPKVTVASALYKIESLTDDPNLPMPVKPILWNLISSLESSESRR